MVGLRLERHRPTGHGDHAGEGQTTDDTLGGTPPVAAIEHLCWVETKTTRANCRSDDRARSFNRSVYSFKSSRMARVRPDPSHLRRIETAPAGSPGRVPCPATRDSLVVLHTRTAGLPLKCRRSEPDEKNAQCGPVTRVEQRRRAARRPSAPQEVGL